MEIALGSTDENTDSFKRGIIGQEPHQTHGENRNLAVSLTEEPIYQLCAAQALLFGECVSSFHKKQRRVPLEAV